MIVRQQRTVQHVEMSCGRGSDDKTIQAFAGRCCTLPDFQWHFPYDRIIVLIRLHGIEVIRIYTGISQVHAVGMKREVKSLDELDLGR